MIRTLSVKRAFVMALCAGFVLPSVAVGFVSHKLVIGPNINVPESGLGNPYPSALNVDDIDGVIESMTVTFFVTHATPDDLDVLLVGPNGAKVVLMSDVGGTADLSNKQIRFKDGAAVLPDNALIDQVEYQPTNIGGTDTFPAPAPGGAAATSLGAAFGGINPNGQWRLFIVDDSATTGGRVTSWRVTITTRVTIQGEGATIPTVGAASRYPSLISIAQLRGRIARVEVRINGLTHNNPDDIDVLVLGPSGKRVRLMSDAGGIENLVNVNLRFTDSAKSKLPDKDQIESGIFKPTDYGVGDDDFPSPAPGTPYEDTLSVFNGDRAEGNWRLFVADDTSPTGGSFASWSLTIVTNNNPPSIAAIPAQTVDTGGVKNVNLTATDGEGDFLVFTESLGSFFTLFDHHNGTASLQMHPLAGDAGTYNNLQVRVSDGEFTTSQSFNLVVNDKTPPNTSAVVDPPPNTAGWNNTDLTVHITATDADSAIDFIRVSTTGAVNIPPTDVSGPAVDVAIGSAGTTTIFYQARDAAGNMGSVLQKTVKLDMIKPTLVTAPGRLFRLAQLGPGDSMPLALTNWAFQDEAGGSGLARYRLRVSVDGGALTDFALPSPLATSANVFFDNNHTYRHTLDAFDTAGNVGDPQVSQTFVAHLVQETDPNIVYTSGWLTPTGSDVSGGQHKSTTLAGEKATFTFNGTHVAWVAILCPACGIAEVRVDGGSPVTVDLYGAGRTTKIIVFSKFSLSNANHTVEIRATGTKNAASTATRVDLDAMAFLDVQ